MNITPETLAIIAAHLLRDNDYKGAVKRAYDLVKAAEAEIQMQQGTALQPAEPDIPDHLDYKAGIRFIIGQKRTDRAEQYFTDFMEGYIRRSKIAGGADKKDIQETEPEELASVIARYERDGFEGLELDALRTMYQRFSGKCLDSVSGVKN